MPKKLGKYLISLGLVIAVLAVVFLNFKKKVEQDIVQQEGIVNAESGSGLTIIDATDFSNYSDEFFETVNDDKIEDLHSDIFEESNETAVDEIESLVDEIKTEIVEEKPTQNQQVEVVQENVKPEKKISENGNFYSKDDVALYIHTYKKLPKNFITKKQAEALGWSAGSPVSDFAEGKVIGGDRFGNYEGILPKKSGRSYTECDIDSLGKKSRGAKRIVFSNDGLIYYTSDHYESFTLLYGDE